MWFLQTMALKAFKKFKYFSKNSRALFKLPMKASRPSANKQSLSNISKISLDGWWMVQMIVLPFLAKFFIHSTTEMAMKESSPLVGSSQNKTNGFVRTSAANARRRFSPPLSPFCKFSPPIIVFSHFFKFSFIQRSRALASTNTILPFSKKKERRSLHPAWPPQLAAFFCP